jgi:hypothetical protein
MDNYTAVGIAEGFIDAESQDQYIEAWQHLIDTGMAWSLQGWFGRTAMRLIEDGYCTQPARNTSLQSANALGKIQFISVGA